MLYRKRLAKEAWKKQELVEKEKKDEKDRAETKIRREAKKREEKINPGYIERLQDSYYDNKEPDRADKESEERVKAVVEEYKRKLNEK